MKARTVISLAAIAAAWVMSNVYLVPTREATAMVLPLDGDTRASVLDRSRGTAGAADSRYESNGALASKTAGALYGEFQIVPEGVHSAGKSSTSSWADKLASVGVIPSVGANAGGIQSVLETYGGTNGKFSGLLNEVGSLDSASNTRYLLPRCDSWACGDVMKALPGVAFPLAFAGIALVILSRARRKRAPVKTDPAEVAS